MIHSYSPKHVLIIGGVIPLTQWDEVTIEYEEDSWEFEVGCYGEVVRKKIKNSFGTITITVPQTSSVNSTLSMLKVLTDNAFDAGDYSASTQLDMVIPFSIVDLWGGSLFVMGSGTIVKSPMVGFGKDVKSRQWVIKGNIDVNVMNVLNTAGNLLSLI